MIRPLTHIRIVDLSRILAGPFCTQLLADLGAEVQKVEPPEGDPTRGWGPPFDEADAAYFLCANRGKRSTFLDLHEADGLEWLHLMLKDADVLVENFLPESAHRLGLTWERLHERHPKLILASIRGFASDVEAWQRPGYDFILQAECGWMSVTGEADGRPMKVGMALVDVLAALYCANGIQAAILHRERSGEAIHVEVPLLEAALAGLVNVGAGALATGQPPERYGNAHPHIVPYETFACLDGDIALGVGSDRQFEVLALWIGVDLEENPHWRKNRGRVEDRKRLVPLLARKFAERRVQDALGFCEAHAIPASKVRSVDDILFRQAGRLHHLITALQDDASGRMVPLLASPLLLNGLRACAKVPPPRRRP